MSAKAEPPVTAYTNDIVDLTEGMSDIDVDNDGSAEDNNVDGETKSAGLHAKKKKIRKNWHGGMMKSKKALLKANKLTNLQGNDGMFGQLPQKNWSKDS